MELGGEFYLDLNTLSEKKIQRRSLPIRVKNRDALRCRLMEHRIYCAVHWPFDGVQADKRPLARKLAAQMLSLSIDQRYDTAHIDYLMDTLDTYKGLLL